jgi:GNAT superfamily N-acetyltransferase
MLSNKTGAEVKQSSSFLDHLYQCESGETFLYSTEKGPKGSSARLASTYDWIPMVVVDNLQAEGFIQTSRQFESDAAIKCWITPKGMNQLQMHREQKLLKGKEIQISNDSIKIRVANAKTAEINLQFETPEDFWSSQQLSISGTLECYGEPIEGLAKVGIHVLDADTAYFQNDFKLGTLFAANSFASFNQDILDNHFEDGEPAHNMAELADMLGLVDAANRKIILIDRMLLDPVLIGRGVGKELLRRLLLAYGHGGGIVVIPLVPTAAPMGSSDYISVCERLKYHYRSLGFESHPFVDNVMVGDIDVVGMMMSADLIRE